jgi:hypothetical protein
VAGSLILTVDVERDWAADGTRGITECLPPLLELLDRHDASATFFVVADLVDVVRPLLPASNGHEVGSHSLTHRRLTDLHRDEVATEVRRSKEVLESAGYRVEGFRSPFWAAPPDLNDLLVDSGYRYDASHGRMLPTSRRATVPAEPPRPVGHVSGCGLASVPSSVLRDGRSPLSLTYLRLYHPLGRVMVPGGTQQLSLHLHELLDHTRGWDELPRPLRRLHRRTCGAPAWRILDRLLGARGATSCRDHLTARIA